MSGPGDIDGQLSGDEAAWRDLIARFDAPADLTSAGLPWPASEDLSESAGDAAGYDTDTAEPGAGAAEHGGGPAEHRSGETQHVARPVDGGGPAEHRSGETEHRSGETEQLTSPAERGQETTGHRSRGTEQVASPGEHGSGSAEHRSGADQVASPAEAGAADPAGPQAGANLVGFSGLPATPVARFSRPPDHTRVIRDSGDPRSYTPAEESDEPFVPAPLPPPARLDSVTKAALVGVVGGPGYLLIASMFLHWTISAGAALVAVAAFVAGFVTLVVKLGDRSGRDDGDDGAVL
jgi:hypothetical protein